MKYLYFIIVLFIFSCEDEFELNNPVPLGTTIVKINGESRSYTSDSGVLHLSNGTSQFRFRIYENVNNGELITTILGISNYIPFSNTYLEPIHLETTNEKYMRILFERIEAFDLSGDTYFYDYGNSDFIYFENVDTLMMTFSLKGRLTFKRFHFPAIPNDFLRIDFSCHENYRVL